MIHTLELEHILRCIEIQYSRLLSIRRSIEMRYSRLRSILICITILYRSLCLSVFPAICGSAVARALPWCCLVIRTHVSLPMFHLKIHCRKCPLWKRVNWKASRVTKGAAYSWEVRSSICWCRPGWELGSFSCCRPGWRSMSLLI